MSKEIIKNELKFCTITKKMTDDEDDLLDIRVIIS